MHPTAHSPWYREPWPWLLMAGPVGVVVAGIVTTWLAFSHEDGLVADDYYKQGLAINRVLARDAQARAIGVGAGLRFHSTGVSVTLAGDAPDALTLSLLHPTRAGQDRVTRLQATGSGRYAGALDVPADGRWHLVLSDAAGKWRLVGDWSAAQGADATLVANPGAGRP